MGDYMICPKCGELHPLDQDCNCGYSLLRETECSVCGRAVDAHPQDIADNIERFCPYACIGATVEGVDLDANWTHPLRIIYLRTSSGRRIKLDAGGGCISSEIDGASPGKIIPGPRTMDLGGD